MDKSLPMQFERNLISTKTRRLLNRIAVFLKSRDAKAYLVGGYVRDILLKRKTADIDIAVKGNALELAKPLAEKLGGTFVPLDMKNRVARIVLKDAARTEIDFTSFRGKIEADLERRDFTINAIAIDLDEVAGSGNIQLIDPLNGINDLDNRVVRSASETAFSDDPVRVLRAVRFQTELGFRIDRHTGALAKKAASFLNQCAGERIREELMRLLDASHDAQTILYVDKLGIINAAFPEMIRARGVTQPVEHHWDVYDHSLKCVGAVDYVLHSGGWDYDDKWILKAIPWPAVCPRYFSKQVASGSTHRSLMKLAALLHDIAKPQTKAPDKNGRMRFLGHPEQGAEIVENIMERLHFSSKEAKFVTVMVKYHLRPTQMGQPPTSRAIYRFFRDTGDAGLAVLYLSLADHLATRGPGLIPEGWKEHTNIVRCIIKEHFRRDRIEPPRKLVDGHDLINVFGLKPGPKLGKLLEAVREAQATGELTNRQQTLDYIRNVLTGRKNR
ncbi:MAG TPA: HD domain-containing protein [Dehalococcoidales bacterium]|nr:HD domain-containing protein [Dehalococcoidales bacterium]